MNHSNLIVYQINVHFSNTSLNKLLIDEDISAENEFTTASLLLDDRASTVDILFLFCERTEVELASSPISS